jgi:hypothetical protein
MPQNGYGDQNYGDQAYQNGEGYGDSNGQAYDDQGYSNGGYGNGGYGDGGYGNGQGYGQQSYGGQAYGAQQYGGQPTGAQQYGAQQYGGQPNPGQYGGQANGGQQYGGQPNGGQQYGGPASAGPQYASGQQYRPQGYDGQAYPEHGGYDRPERPEQPRYGQGQGQGGYGQGQPGYDQGYREQPAKAIGSGYEDQSTQAWYDDPRHHPGQRGPGQGYPGQGQGQGYQGQPGQTQAYSVPGRERQRNDVGGPARTGRPGGPGGPGGPTGPGGPGGRGGPNGPLRTTRPNGPGRPNRPSGPRLLDTGPDARPRKVRFRRTRRLARNRYFQVISAIVAIFLAYQTFSLGKAAFANNGQGFTANAAEWARDNNLGFVVTFGEWLSYNPPKVGGKPTINYAVPSGEAVTPPNNKKHAKGFQPDIPATLKPLASGPALPGEGQWRVLEKVHGYPAILMTLLRDGGQYTSYTNAVASMDQRLVKFSLRPGYDDPGMGSNWGVPDYIPQGQRTGLLATFNGGFRMNVSGGGFYLNGNYHGSLVDGAASVVYYKNGTIKVGQWGRDFKLNSSILGVRQNLKLLVDHGKVAIDPSLAVNSSFGATLGGGAWVWRSGLGITKDDRIVYVYGQALDAHDLATLLQRAGAVEGMQLDINPAWMKYDYYVVHGNPADPTPLPMLPGQPAAADSYYTPSFRDFTAVYAR